MNGQIQCLMTLVCHFDHLVGEKLVVLFFVFLQQSAVCRCLFTFPLGVIGRPRSVTVTLSRHFSTIFGQFL